MTRFHREGFLEERVLVHFGLFPWGCMICKRRLLMRTRGELKQKTIQHYTGTSMPLRPSMQLRPHTPDARTLPSLSYRKFSPVHHKKYAR